MLTAGLRTHNAERAYRASELRTGNTELLALAGELGTHHSLVNMYRDKKIGVVVLAYNVEDHIAEVLKDMPDYVDAVYVVDDGSVDDTTDIVRDWIARDSRIRLESHGANRGPGAALSTGYGLAMADEMDIIVKVDGDNQMRLDEMVLLLDPIVDGSADYTKGNRLASAQHRRGMPWFRLMGNTMLMWLTRIASGNWHVNDPQNGYTAISRCALRVVGWDLYPYYGYLNQLLVRLQVYHLRVVDVPMLARYGKEKSAIRLHAYVPRVSALMVRLFAWRATARLAERSPQSTTVSEPALGAMRGARDADANGRVSADT